MRPKLARSLPLLVFPLIATMASAQNPRAAHEAGIIPIDARGKALNLDFESGTLEGWTAEGEAFANQPVEGDTVKARRSDMASNHAGRFWIGTFERAGDKPQGTLTSLPFPVSHPFASFLVAGGTSDATCVEIVRDDSGEVVARVPGDESENLKPVLVDLTALVGKAIRIRLVDRQSGGWGHINFDDFRFHPSKPQIPARPAPLRPDVFAHEGLSPGEAAEAMTVPPGFRVSLFAGEPDIVQPIAMTLDERGRLWVAEAYSYPIRLPEDQAKDRILIFEDNDNDGKFDTRKVFADKLNLVSGLEVGFGGVWVGSAPNLLFIPDRNHDDRPDGPPQVLLDGWGYQDTHETLNSFIWGPDGWLYGCHGVFTHSKVGKPGTPDADRVPINAGVWRYHPTRHQFEVFAHGTSNPWGVDFDEHGQCFITACVIPHLYHMIQGGRYQRQAGQHFNPYTYDDIKTIGDHVHYLGANPHGGNNRSDAAGGGHAHAGALIYNGDAWPAEYRGSLFMNNIHGARLNRDLLEPSGSGFIGRHAPDFLMANDRWSQLLYFRTGPDGNVFMIDWYDKAQCHLTDPRAHDRSNGRIFKISYGRKGEGKIDKLGTTTAELTDQALSNNQWTSRQARRRLQELATVGELAGAERRGVVARLATSAFDVARGKTPDRLQALWALHAIGGLDGDWIRRGLTDSDPFIRAWSIQFACESGRPDAAALAAFAGLARSDESPVVRLYLASACQRLPLADRWPILEGLIGHAEDSQDHNLPLMYWYAAEPLAAADSPKAAALAASSKIPLLLSYMTRRLGAIGTNDVLALLVGQLGKVDKPADRLALLEGINSSLQGRRLVEMPKGWPAVAPALIGSKDSKVRSQALALALTFGDPAALAALRAKAMDLREDAVTRREALESLVRVRAPELAPALRKLIDDADLRSTAIRGLAAYDDAETPAAILATYTRFAPSEKRDALGTLTTRPAWALALLDAVSDGKVARNDLTADLVRQMRNLKHAPLDERIGKVWGSARETSADKASAIARFKAMLTARPKQTPDPMLGRALYARTCGSCHVLFGTGGNVGPEITGSNRADLDYVLSNVLDPSALIGKDYQAHILALADGRVLTGIIKAEDRNAMTLVTANETLVIPVGDIEEKKMSDQSMMPEGQWDSMSEHEIRSLIAYLASPAQVPMLATKENARMLFNGRDLALWDGDGNLWSVQDGEIVGKTAGLKENHFLRSQMAAKDFRLNFEVKLVRDEGNSGVQFRSQPLPEGDVKGYQADIGNGWWGKIYEEHGRGLIGKEPGEGTLKPGEWNSYELIANGTHIETRINGKTVNKIDDPNGARVGIFALQLHSGGATEVRFRNFTLEPLEK
ncbi:MAG: PVC-type heme-binding CxxCH protein [Isosphaeraceae bacterium]